MIPDASDHEVQLGAYCKRVTVGHVGPMADQYRDDGIPFLRSQDIQPFGIQTKGFKLIDEQFNYKLRKSALRAGDVVIVRTGYPGTAAVVPQKLDGANCADLVILTPGPQLDPWFVVSLLNSTWGRSTVAGNLVGVAQQHFNVGAAKTLRFRLPALSTQRRIGQIVKTYCDLIEVNTRRIAILEEMARRLFHGWFDKPEIVPGHVKGGAIDCLCQLVKKNFIEDQHADWPLLDLSRIPSRSLAPRRSGDPSELAAGRIIFQAGDTLFGAIRPYLHKVVVAPYPGVTNVSVLVLRPRRKQYRSVLTILASDLETVRWADQHSGGTKMPVIKWDILKTMPAPVPDTEQSAKFESTAGPMIDGKGLCLCFR